MARILGSIDSVLEELSRLWCRDDPSVHDQFMRFEDGLGFLSAFVRCIESLDIPLEVVPQWRSLQIKIKAAIRKIRTQVMKMKTLAPKSCRDIWERTSSNCADVLTNMMVSQRREASTKWLDVKFTKLNAIIYLLKPLVMQICDALIGVRRREFRFSIHRDDRLKVHVRPIASHLEDLKRKFDSVEGWKDRIQAIEDKHLLAQDFNSTVHSNVTEFVSFKIDINTEAVGAILLSCRWWAMEFNPTKKNNIFMAFEFLQDNIWSCTGNFAGSLLYLLKALSSHCEVVDVFVDHLLLFKVKFKEYPVFARLNTLQRVLISLLTSFIATEQQKFLEEVKEVIVEVGALKYSLHIVDEEGTGNMLPELVAKIWLLNIEIFLMAGKTDVSILFLSVKEQIDDLIQGANQIKESADEHTENVNKILLLRKEVAKAVASLGNISFPNQIRNNMGRHVRCLLLLNMLLLTVHLKLNNNNESLVVSIKNQIESFHEPFKFLKIIVIDKPDDSVMVGKLEFADTKASATRLFSLCHLFLADHITEEMLNDMNLLLADLLNKIRLIMAKLKEIYLPAPRSNFPKTNAMGFFDTFLSSLRELLNSNADLVVSVKQPIEEISGLLEFFRPFLWDILGKGTEDQEWKNLGACVIDVAYELEYLIDSIMGQNGTESQNIIWLYHLLQDVRLLKIRVTKVHDKKTYEIKNVPRASNHMVSRATSPVVDETIVGLNDQEEVINDLLIGGFPQRNVVSIVGMAGIGKTTLAKKVYNSPRIMYHFQIRAWGCVSEVYRKRNLLLQILSHITAITDKILEMTDEDLDLKLCQLLKQKKYLIVLDDIWNIEVWDDLGRSFPNDRNGSRVLVTSRLLHVAFKAEAHINVHPLRLLSGVESWDLLQMKIFHDEQCPAELMDIGMQIARSCKGLPLAIVAMAGLLGRIDRQAKQWTEIVEDFISQIVDDPQEQCRKILELSYRHLPNYLKACFLYFGAFIEDENIPVRKLMQMWIAEGFVQKTGFKNLEHLAEEYLMDLIGRSLILVAERSSIGGVKACRIHDMLRNLCLAKAKEENFLQVITRFDGSSDSLDDLDYSINVNYNNPLNSITYDDHRLCFCSKRKHFVESSPSGPHVRTLLFFASNDMYPRCPYDISFIFHKFKFLKVLDVKSINMGTSFPNGIEGLVHLRYLAATGDIDSVPPSIGKLWKLETFYVNGLKGKVKLPDTIWCLGRLRHVHVRNLSIFSLPDNIGNSFKLYNLITLSSPLLHYGADTRNILRQFPNLQKLGCIFSESWDNSQNCNQFPSLKILNQLESLKLAYHGKALRPGEFNFPVNLKKLTLSNFRMPWSHISTIGSLPNLEVLKLLSRAFDGQRWDTMEGEFSELKYLKLDTLNIAKWNACSDHFPKLQQLVVRFCKQLEEIPSSFVEVPTLQLIEVQWCGDSVEESVRKLKDEADEVLKIIINLSDLDSRSSY